MDAHAHRESVYDARAMIVEAVIVAVNDTGQAQTVDVQSNDGITRSAIEVMQIFGVASRAPVAGGIALLLAVGGDVGHYMALPLANPSIRFGNLNDGDGGVIYAPDGTRVAAMAGGILEIVGVTKVLVQSPNVEIDAPNGVAINGPATIDGNVAITGTLGVTGNVSVTGNMNVSGTITAAHVNTTG